MLGLDQAIVNRWNAAGLNVSIGTLWDHQIPEGTDLRVGPYCSFEDVSDERFAQTRINRYQRAMIQFTVYDLTKEAVGSECELIDLAFTNSNLAAVNPLVLSGSDGIVNCNLIGPYTINQISDTIWAGSQTISVLYSRVSLLI